MYWRYDGVANKMYLYGKATTNLYGPHLSIERNSGQIGIGTYNASALLHIKQTTGDTAEDGIRIERSSVTNHWYQHVRSDNNLHWYYNSTSTPRAYLDNTVNVGDLDFTGQHRSLPQISKSVEDYIDKVGLIVSSLGIYTNLSSTSSFDKPTINEALPRVELSSIPYDKRVFGVISNTEDTGSIRKYHQGAFVTSYPKESGSDDRIIINALGEGAMWVSNYSGSLENGDYITSSPIEGLGMKQDDDLLHNYTVAKITQDCSFNLSASNYNCIEFDWSGSTYKKAFVGVTYHCG